MRIKFPFVDIETNTACPCKNYDEYELKLKCMRTKLHCRYIACIATGIVIWLITTGTSSNEKFPELISFASTITSIILSVIAIIMSITGESKTDAMRNQMERTTKKLEDTVDIVENANRENVGNIKELKENIKILEKKIENMPGMVTEVIKQYEKTSYLEDGVIKKSINDNAVWVKKND